MCGLFVLSATKASSLNVISFAKKKGLLWQIRFQQININIIFHNWTQ